MKISIKLLLIILLMVTSSVGAKAYDWSVNKPELEKPDTREIKLKKYLENQNSPLSQHSNDLIEIADKYELRYSFIPAITGRESTFCKFIPQYSFNCYGWGPSMKFKSWEDGMEKVAKGLKENYIQKWGKDTVDKIAPTYASSLTWASGVKNFMLQIENTAISEYHTLEPNL
jgi:hypothetical protein